MSEIRVPFFSILPSHFPAPGTARLFLHIALANELLSGSKRKVEVQVPCDLLQSIITTRDPREKA
jgi:hypothetical protein